MEYYPINLNLEGKKTVVIGGGKVAERKVRGLLEAKADITVISPKLTEGLYHYQQLGTIKWKEKSFSSDDITEAFLIISAVNHPEVSLAVKKAAGPNQLINLADRPEESNFILPSSFKQGRLSITVSTSGASPILAKKIKHKLSKKYGADYKEYLDFLYDSRKWILREVTDAKIKQQLLTAITEDNFLNSINRENDFQELLSKYLKS
ncbi:precorrin-2 dehydrogenase/sirohydrochlorin ferrochelatase family protein [Bacillus tuaregi]|uniref:precorrin-2 dehydrogenase/sirohydrochlorin ferrochelatase family protein n=1 Tax=Bacillus tuaregi TaxID=1816695 RepID=UPI0008F8C5FE|nr:NAD(P)-dependent oxidoreductase [Bacillus tuaregi]